MIQKGKISNGVKVIACIPARYGSTRFAGKILTKDTSKFLIRHTYEQLRAIENGYSIIVGKVEHTCDGIDKPQQYAEFVKRQDAKKAKIKMQESK